MNDNHLSNFLDIKNYRKSFIESFDTNDIEIKKKLINAINDINLQSIRIHKFITHNGKIGKVLFARFLIEFIKHLIVSNTPNIAFSIVS